MIDETQTRMATEAAEAPDRIALQAASLAEPLADLAAKWSASPPRAIVTCARGSSDHAALYGKYALEIATGLPVASLGPSVVSVHETPLRLDGMLYITVSQSGQSPDLLRCAEAARAGGALVVAIVNDSASPLAGAADIVLDMKAGPEHAVAATKSFLCTLSTIARLIAAITDSPATDAAVDRLPDQLRSGSSDPWPSEIVDRYADAGRAFVIGRGPGLGVAAELALKAKEVAGLHAEAFSAAEVQHGPKAAIGPDSPVILLGTEDAAKASVEEAARTVSALGAPTFGSLVAVPGIVDLPTVRSGHPLTQPIVQAGAFYGFIEKLSRRRGLDPDNPPSLRKVTKTL
ncbi:MAG: SIS domain-containing protein [Erythrobacter sp.]|uniref:SIS domain-containing protein n=1 Tax=Erythrobacter sp. TaxID=1042 RepID=UPI001B18E1FD|nr:SIS domain-containing protein [Erythrobacter sp.]MBO6767662.1 SIS domain-containing protein [Erythrobacter sp.]